jgi:hypothetical protein
MQTLGAENATIYTRIPFTVTPQQLNSMAALRLRVRYDDAYIAYLNGVEIARKGLASTFAPAYNSASSSIHSDSLAIVYENVDITSFKNLLQANNVLAIHGMNFAATGGSTNVKDFLLGAKLEMDALSGVAATEYTAPVTINNNTEVKARVLIGLLWGPITDSNFLINAVPASASNVVISEMHYNPLDPTAAEVAAGANNANDFEFIEIMNISGSTVDLTNCRFTEGITFNWFDAPASVQTLAPGQRMVICENITAFNLRYAGRGAVVAGAFAGNLSNGGETVRFIDKDGADIKHFTYDDDPPWPKDADGGQYDNAMPPNLIGGGYSLVLKNPLSNPDHNVGTNWRSSATVHGCPGVLDYTPFTGSATGDTDNDGIPNIIEYAAGSVATSGNQSNLPAIGSAEYNVNNTTDTYLTFTFTRSLNAGNVEMTPQVSSNLSTWQDGSVAMTYVGAHNNGDGTESVVWRSTQPVNLLTGRLFARLMVVQQ